MFSLKSFLICKTQTLVSESFSCHHYTAKTFEQLNTINTGNQRLNLTNLTRYLIGIRLKIDWKLVHLLTR